MITLQTQRVLWDNAGTLEDLSVKLNDFRSGTEVVPILGGEYLYIGSDLPFSFRYFDFEAISSSGAVVDKVQYMTSEDSWVDAVDIIDQTEGFSQNGYISWKTDEDTSGWTKADDTRDTSDLSSVTIYDLYWIRIRFDSDLSNTTELKSISFRFSFDSDMYGEWPDLDNQQMRDSFKPNLPLNTKTNWEEQQFIAAEKIVRDLKKRNITWSGNTIIDYENWREASYMKAAEIIYASQGGEAASQCRKLARDYYNEAFEQNFLRLDRNRDAIIDCGEESHVQTDLKR